MAAKPCLSPRYRISRTRVRETRYLGDPRFHIPRNQDGAISIPKLGRGVASHAAIGLKTRTMSRNHECRVGRPSFCE